MSNRVRKVHRAECDKKSGTSLAFVPISQPTSPQSFRTVPSKLATKSPKSCTLIHNILVILFEPTVKLATALPSMFIYAGICTTMQSLGEGESVSWFSFRICWTQEKNEEPLLAFSRQGQSRVISPPAFTYVSAVCVGSLEQKFSSLGRENIMQIVSPGENGVALF